MSLSSLALRALPLALLAGAAHARLGGGEQFGGGGGGDGGGGSFGGGGGDGGDGAVALIRILLWLIIHHPGIGIPLTILVIVAFVVTSRSKNKVRRTAVHRAPLSRPSPTPTARTTGLREGLAALRRDDPNFSEPLFLDFAALAYTRAAELRSAGRREPLAPYFAPQALDALLRDPPEATRDVIIGSVRLTGAASASDYNTLVVNFETNLTERRGGKDQQLLSKELWRFRRRRGVRSPGPEGMRAEGCPSCGSTAEIQIDGSCPSCGSVRTGGETQWEVSAVEVRDRRPLGAIELHLGGGEEPGTRLPTVLDPELGRARRAFEARHGDHDWGVFRSQINTIFLRLQDAWSSGRWEQARPYETDALFQSHRFWIERYKAQGLRNHIEKARVEGMELARIDTDAFLETVTVRLRASMIDTTEDAAGRLIAGSRDEPRVFTEYWTLVRSIGGKGRRGVWRPDTCPSCGAPLDKVSLSGVCGYCDSKITSGEFDWVLSRIEQDDVYAG